MQEISEERRERLRALGLHYCRYYENIVRYNEPACRKCRHCTYPTK